MSKRAKWTGVIAAVTLAVGCLGLVIGRATATPAACQDAVVAIDAVFEVMPIFRDGVPDAMTDEMVETRIRMDRYSELRAQCLG